MANPHKVEWEKRLERYCFNIALRPCFRKLWQKVLSLQKDRSAHKALGDKASTLAKSIKELTEQHGDLDLNDVKASLANIQDAPHVLAALTKGGFADHGLDASLNQLIAWTSSTIVTDEKFQESLAGIADQAQASVVVSHDGSLETISKEFTEVHPNLSQAIDQAFLLRCCLT